MFYSIMQEGSRCDSATFGAAHHSFEVLTLNAIDGCIYGICIRYEYRFIQGDLNILCARYIFDNNYIISNIENKLRTLVLYYRKYFHQRSGSCRIDLFSLPMRKTNK